MSKATSTTLREWEKPTLSAVAGKDEFAPEEPVAPAPVAPEPVEAPAPAPRPAPTPPIDHHHVHRRLERLLVVLEQQGVIPPDDLSNIRAQP